MYRLLVRPLSLLFLLSTMLGTDSIVSAETALDLSDRIVIDGFSDEFTAGESIFGRNPSSGLPEESDADSEWGTFNDLNQIKITWDADSLYLAVDAIIFDNNTILLVDLWPGVGLREMTELGSWRRNFVFSEDFRPDWFLATWDGNSLPQVWHTTSSENVVNQVPDESFRSVATFSQSAAGRSMEAAIPWNVVFPDSLTEAVDVPELGTEVWEIPPGMETMKIAAVITAGPDGTGGPDSAPDNFNGHNVDSSAQVTVDNFAILSLDEDEIVGFPDFGIEPRDRVSFKVRPPIEGKAFDISRLELMRSIVSPEEGLDLEFEFVLDPLPDPGDGFRSVNLTARIYDMLGNLVKELYRDDTRPVLGVADPGKDRWDGRRPSGELAGGGIYILSLVSEPGLSRMKRAFSVVR